MSRTLSRRTREPLTAQLSRRLDGLDLVALFGDGVVVAGQTVIVLLGITRDGRKEPLGVSVGSTENAAGCTRSRARVPPAHRAGQIRPGAIVVFRPALATGRGNEAGCRRPDAHRGPGSALPRMSRNRARSTSAGTWHHSCVTAGRLVVRARGVVDRRDGRIESDAR